MGIFAEERKRGTMELLMTSPISEGQIVLGKFFASLTLYAIMLLPTASYLACIFLRSSRRRRGGCCWQGTRELCCWEDRCWRWGNLFRR